MSTRPGRDKRLLEKKSRLAALEAVCSGGSRSSCIQSDALEIQMTSSTYRWVIVAAGGLLGCVAIGGMFSLPVFLQPIAHDTGWSVTGVSSAMTIGFLAMACTSMIWGTLS